MSPNTSMVVRRLAVANGQYVNLMVEVTKGAYSGAVDWDCSEEELGAFGRALSAFPSKGRDRYEFRREALQETRNVLFDLRTDSRGRCTLDMTMTIADETGAISTCTISTRAEALAINRLGQLLLGLCGRASGTFRWTPVETEGVSRQGDAV